MNSTNETGEIAEALAKAQAEVKDPDRKKTVKVRAKSGAKYDFAYATFNQGLDIFRSVYSKHGLAFYQSVVWIEGKPFVQTVLLHTCGERLVSHWPVCGFAWDDAQRAGSATTYAKRYALFALMGINGDDDDDGNITSGNHFEETDGKKKQEKAEQKNTKYDELFSKDSYKVDIGDMSQDEFVYELARYAKRANNCDELDRLITDNLDTVSHFEDNVRRKFIQHMDKNYKEIDQHAEFPAAVARSLS